jgi:hypothetical protein
LRRSLAAVISAGLVGATLAGAVRSPDDDGFPLSTYPMFARPRPAQVALAYAIGVTAGGATRALGPEALGTGEVLQALARVRAAIDAGEGDALCRAIAARVAGGRGLADVEEIRLVTGVHDAVAAIALGAPGALRVEAACRVGR